MFMPKVKASLIFDYGIQYVNEKCWKITGIHLEFVCLVKLPRANVKQIWEKIFENICEREEGVSFKVLFKDFA